MFYDNEFDLNLLISHDEGECVSQNSAWFNASIFTFPLLILIIMFRFGYYPGYSVYSMRASREFRYFRKVSDILNRANVLSTLMRWHFTMNKCKMSRKYDNWPTAFTHSTLHLCACLVMVYNTGKVSCIKSQGSFFSDSAWKSCHPCKCDCHHLSFWYVYYLNLRIQMVNKGHDKLETAVLLTGIWHF